MIKYLLTTFLNVISFSLVNNVNMSLGFISCKYREGKEAVDVPDITF